MIKITAATVFVVPLTMLMLGACAGDLLFPEGGYRLSTAGKTELNNNIVPKLTGLRNAKVVVYGYTDNLPVGAPLQRAGINDNLTLSSRRAGDVVTYLVVQGVNPSIISAKGFGNTHPVAGNDTPDRLRRITGWTACRRAA